ncbi:MAG: hypothetical protein LBI82_05500 [Dysgonamonadaceae bacterium]|jgi:hypothetical protein|nr:hypothetical protein [Dysgonamonadaceae bacterium]
MDSNLFDKKISELLEQNENSLPSFTNKEIVWKDIESKLQKPRKIKLLYYTVISAAACVALVVGLTFFSRSERINENGTMAIQTNSPRVEINEITQEVHENEQLIVKENADFTVDKKEKTEKPVNKKTVVTEVAKEENLLANVFAIEEEHPEVSENIEEIASQPNDLLAAIPTSEIKVRVSLSPGKQKNQKNDKIEFRLPSIFLASNDDRPSNINVKENQISNGIFQIPLK